MEVGINSGNPSSLTTESAFNDTWHVAMGAQHALTPTLSIGGAYEFVWMGDMPVDQERGPLAGRVSGEYGSSNMSFFALNLIWKY